MKNLFHQQQVLIKLSITLAFTLLLLASAGVSKAGNIKPDTPAPLLVFAASSLAPVMASLSENFKNNSGIDVSFSYGSSAILARQISEGAPAQVFITADDRWLNWLEIKTEANFAAHPVMANQIVLAARANLALPALAGNPQAEDFKTLIDNLDNKTIAIADAQTVPLGSYSNESLLYLGLDGVFKPYTILSNSAQANLRFLTTGAVSMAIIYKSDLGLSPNLQQVFAFPRHSHKKIVYLASIMPHYESSSSVAFINYLKTMEAGAIFIEYGFTPINDNQESDFSQ